MAVEETGLLTHIERPTPTLRQVTMEWSNATGHFFCDNPALFKEIDRLLGQRVTVTFENKRIIAIRAESPIRRIFRRVRNAFRGRRGGS
jgi:hypothetical protein